MSSRTKLSDINPHKRYTLREVVHRFEIDDSIAEIMTLLLIKDRVERGERPPKHHELREKGSILLQCHEVATRVATILPRIYISGGPGMTPIPMAGGLMGAFSHYYKDEPGN